MRQIWIMVCVLALIPASLFAEEQKKPSSGHGYGFWGIGGINAEEKVQHYGFGAEGYVFRGLGAGVELGYLAPFQHADSGVGVLSINGLYDFDRSKLRGISPFVTGGYSLAFREGVGNAVNFGGGIHYWFRDRCGLRLEFRDHVPPAEWDVHFWEMRVGLSFR
jgi:hypothetical protein